MAEPDSGAVDLDALRAHVLSLGDLPVLSAADTALPERLRDLLGTFPNGACQGTGSGPPALDAGNTTLTLSLTCASFAWPAGASATVVTTGVTVTVTNRGAVTLTLGGTFDKVEVTSTVTAARTAQVTAAVRPVRPGAFGAALEELGERFGGAAWPSAKTGLSEFGFDLGDVAGFDYRLEKGQQGGYKVASVAVVADLDVKSLPLQVAVWLPDLRVTGRVRGDAPVGVASLLESFGVPAGELPGELAIGDLRFAAALGRAYILRMKVTGLWTIGSFGLTSLSLDLAYNSAEKFVATVAGTAAIGSSLDIALSATRSGGATGGWTFQGGLAPDTDLGVADLVAALGLTDVPEPVKSLELTSLWFTHTTGSGGYDVRLRGDMTIADGVRASLGVTATHDRSGTRYAGTLEVDGYDFEVVFDKDRSGVDVLAAAFRGPEGGLEIVLRDWVAHLSEDLAEEVPDSLRIGLKDAKFVRVKPPDGPARFCLGIDLSADIDLSQLPLVGGFVSAAGSLAVQNLQILYSSGDFSPQAVGVVNGLLDGVVPLPEAGLKAGVAALAELNIGGQSTPIALGVPATNAPAPSGGGQSRAPATQGSGSAPSGKAGSTGQWITVQKKLGVVQINRVGVIYQHNVLLFALDAGVTLGPLSMTFDGLAVGSPLNKFEPTFNLDGLGISYDAPPVRISAALLHLPDDLLAPGVAFQYDGTATIALPDFSLAAIGSYAQLTSGEPSLFVFAQLEGPLLELPPVLINGLMAGFGFNRELAMPSAAEVTGYPLLVLNKQGPDANQDKPSFVLDVLEGREPAVPGTTPRQWIAPREGSYWLALGVEFNIADVVNAKMLLAAEFGHELVLAVLGIATLQLPQPSESATRTYVYAELGLEAVIQPNQGSFELAAQLSPASYVLTPACHLTGGFACAFWYGPNPNAGQFVITLGGYHPAFQVPAHYPKVPRLGIDWTVSDCVSIKAQAYLAVTPSCAMAGGRLEAVFHSGPLRAWFTAQADLLVSWRPFHFDASISVSIGASLKVDVLFVHKTLTASVGADLALWGPPTGGVVSAHLLCITVTVSFGAGRHGSGSKTLAWEEFAGLLPQPQDMITIAPVSGLDKSVDDGQGGKRWLVRARDLRLFTQSAIPASHLRFGEQPLAASDPDDGPLVDIRPMKLGGLVGEHRLRLFFEDEPASADAWTLTPRVRTVPAQLWGAPLTLLEEFFGRPTADVVAGLPVGYDLQAPRPDLAASRGVFPLSEYTEDELPPGVSPLPPHPAANADFASADDPSCVDLIGRTDQADARAGRDQLYAALADAKLFTGPNDPLTHLARDAGHLFSQAPMTQDTGSRT